MHLDKLIDRMEEQALGLESRARRYVLGLFLCFAMAYGAATMALAANKMFTHDELFTFYLARAENMGDLWKALRLSIDVQPPPFYLVTRFAQALLDDPHIATRLPETIGILLMAVSLYAFAARRMGPLYASVAMIVPFVTVAYQFAYSARPYGLVLGFCALGLLAWQGAADNRRRGLSLFGLALAVAGAISSSYYAVLIVAAFGVGELVRSAQRKAVDWPVWISLGVGASVSFAYLPFALRGVGAFDEANWAAPSALTPLVIYADLAPDSAPMWFALLMILAAYLALRAAPQRERRPTNEEGLSMPELAVGISLLLLPFLGTVVAMLVTKMMMYRYVLSAGIGLSLVLTFVLFRAVAGSRLVAAAFLVVFLGSFAVNNVVRRYNSLSTSERARLETLQELLAGQPKGLPVVVDDPIRCLELSHYASDEVRSRLYLLVPQPQQTRYQHVPYDAEDWLRSRFIMPGQAEELTVFRKTHDKYMLYSTQSMFGYLVAQLREEGADLRLLAVRGRESLYLVNDPR